MGGDLGHCSQEIFISDNILKRGKKFLSFLYIYIRKAWIGKCERDLQEKGVFTDMSP